MIRHEPPVQVECPWCNEMSWGLIYHEVAEDRWIGVCAMCEDTMGLLEGK